MNSNLVASVLRREKELLERMFELATCEPELVESGRTEDLEILLSLRADPLSELAAAEETIDAEMSKMGSPMATIDQLQQLNDLNLAILELADQIVMADETTGWLAQNCAEYTPTGVSTTTRTGFSD